MYEFTDRKEDIVLLLLLLLSESYSDLYWYAFGFKSPLLIEDGNESEGAPSSDCVRLFILFNCWFGLKPSEDLLYINYYYCYYNYYYYYIVLSYNALSSITILT